MIVQHNGCYFEQVRYYDNKCVIKITAINGVFECGESVIYQVHSTSNITTNFGGGFEEWVKDHF